jgi:hypothetical protein
VTNPELTQDQNRREIDLPQQHPQDSVQFKFVSDVYAKVCNDGCPKKETETPPAADAKKDSKMSDNNKASANLDKLGNVESLKLPGGFAKGNEDKRQNFHSFNSTAQKDTKVSYWKRSDYHADEEDSQRIADVFKKPPHVLSEQETLDLMPMMMPGRPWGTGNYRDLSLRSDDIDGRRVLVCDFKMNDQDKQVRLIIANQDNSKHQIENIWLEGPVKDFDINNKGVIDAFQQIKWEKAKK